MCDAASNCTRNLPCSARGCLFDLEADPLEKNDLSTSEPQRTSDTTAAFSPDLLACSVLLTPKAWAGPVLAKMEAAMLAAVATRFQTTNSSYSYSGCAASWEANVAAHGGFAAPMCTTATPGLH